MENSLSARRFLLAASLLAIAVLVSVSCRKKPAAAPAQPEGAEQSPAGQAKPSVEIQPKSSGDITPAIVGTDEDSFSHYIHFPKNPEAAGKDSAVQFYCDISEDGIVQTTYALVGQDDAFKNAVQSALDWGHFKPASVDGKPTAAYIGGTVLFMHQDGAPVIVVSLATTDRERIGKIASYVQPELIGGLRKLLESAEMAASVDLPGRGAAEVLVKVGAAGEVVSANIVSENPKDAGLGDFLAGALKNGHFTPAYAAGKKTAGSINVIANFSEF